MKRDGWLHVYDLGLEEELKYHVMGGGRPGAMRYFTCHLYPSGYMLYGASRAAVDSFMRLQLYVSTMRCRRATMVHLHSPSHPPLACVVASTSVDSPHTSPKPSVQRARIQ